MFYKLALLAGKVYKVNVVLSTRYLPLEHSLVSFFLPKQYNISFILGLYLDLAIS